MLIQVNQVTKNYGGMPVLENSSLEIHEGRKVGLIGNNGSGKSTLLKIMVGRVGVDSGSVSRKKNLVISYVQQLPKESSQSVYSYLLESFPEIQEIRDSLRYFETLFAEQEVTEKQLLRYGQVQEQYEAIGGYTLEDRLDTMLKGMNFQQKKTAALSTLSGGEKVLVEMIRILLTEADVYLLDEPTNHLDKEAMNWLESFIRNSKKTFIIVSHDRYFLDEVVQEIIEIEDGQLRLYRGNYSFYKKEKQLQEEKLAKDYALQQKEIQKMMAAIRRFRQWGNEADNEKFFKKAKELEHRLAKMQRVKRPATERRTIHGTLIESARSGKEVVKVENLWKFYGEQVLFEEASCTIYFKDRLNLDGKNGSGKTSFIQMLLGQEEADEGSIKVGDSVTIGYLPQKIVYKEDNQRLLDYFSEVEGTQEMLRRILAKYNFFGEDVFKRLKDLSGGERVRLELAKLMQQSFNFLILDEPTNHLDIDSREEIEEIIQNYGGTILLVSHDRYFVQKIAEKRLQIENHQFVVSEISEVKK
ncbi:hypothetical protein IGI37_001748 [Enterococcus sp. AZ194]|uniref:ribosomal protection-like ABC-F family protein n=1 Tax=Enterococcus sp. AZ194 TaxID=2774629 RepID=UPI003F1E9655